MASCIDCKSRLRQQKSNLIRRLVASSKIKSGQWHIPTDNCSGIDVNRVSLRLHAQLQLDTFLIIVSLLLKVLSVALSSLFLPRSLLSQSLCHNFARFLRTTIQTSDDNWYHFHCISWTLVSSNLPNASCWYIRSLVRDVTSSMFFSLLWARHYYYRYRYLKGWVSG